MAWVEHVPRVGSPLVGFSVNGLNRRGRHNGRVIAMGADAQSALGVQAGQKVVVLHDPKRRAVAIRPSEDGYVVRGNGDSEKALCVTLPAAITEFIPKGRFRMQQFDVGLVGFSYEAAK